MLRRTLQPVLRKGENECPVVTLTGPRQSGKTALTKATIFQHAVELVPCLGPAHAFQQLAPGRTELRIGRFYISGRLRVGNTFHDVPIHVPGAGDGDERTLLADEARFEVLQGKTPGMSPDS